MKSKLSVAILTLLAATAARGTDHVIIECPASIWVAPFNVPAGWISNGASPEPFMDAKFYGDAVLCNYGNPKTPDLSVGYIFHPLKGTCQVNPSNPRQYDCVPVSGKTLQPKR